jgi:23S rRNA pseudouridine2457 synthase
MPLILLNKPFRVMCQFRDENDRLTLADYIDVSAVYPAGRLDFESEGLVMLTDDGRLQARISEPKHKLDKHYWVQVEGEATHDQMSALQDGVNLKDGMARALQASLMKEPDPLWPRDPPIRQRKSVPTSWVEVVINEGRNRQVRRMTAAVGLPALRLIRQRVGPWALDSLQPGESASMETAAAWASLSSYRYRKN